MVEEGYGVEAGDLGKFAGEGDVFVGGGWVAGWVVVDADYVGGGEEVGFFEDFAGMGDGGVDGAFEEEFFVEVFFLVVEIEDVEVFLFLVFEEVVEVVYDGFGVGAI